jgi:hypothetical protein
VESQEQKELGVVRVGVTSENFTIADWRVSDKVGYLFSKGRSHEKEMPKAAIVTQTASPAASRPGRRQQRRADSPPASQQRQYFLYWRTQYGKMELDQVRRLKKRIADQALDIDILKETLSPNY